ncbi:DUF3558 domain-containing protein [Nocardia sp. NPDC024068]|uniref:DUF3558 domain-containing protein n=1 Tax=Nocardia sp. NPDC024068 TaxID=3157197 RepID=UPI00340D48E7
MSHSLLRRIFAVALSAAAGIAAVGCSADEPVSAPPATTTRIAIPETFDPCEDISDAFIDARGFEEPVHLGNRDRPIYVAGRGRGIGCQFTNRAEYSVDITVSNAALGTDGPAPDAEFRSTRIGGRAAEVVHPQDIEGKRSISIYSCLLLVEMAGGSLHMSFNGYEIEYDMDTACAHLTELATEVVAMLPPGS